MNKNKYIDLSKYEIISKIGQGSFGKVYTIRDNKTQQILAAKISIEYISEDTEQKFKKEIEINSRLDHPAIVKFYGYSPLNFKNEEKPVIVTEFLANNSLKNLLNMVKRGDPPKEWNYTKKIIILYGIASGMLYLQSESIIHRDLKPDNILLDRYLYPKICDFNLSKDLLNPSSSSNYKGTLLYSAPEVLVNKKYSEYSDVYSFSLIAYEIITNEEIFPNLTILNFIEEVVNDTRPEFHSKKYPAIQKLIKDCWQPNPLKRPKFSEILERLKNDENITKDIENQQEFINYVNYVDNKLDKLDQEPEPIELYKPKDRNKRKVTIKTIQNLFDNGKFEFEIETKNEDEDEDEICPKEIFGKLIKKEQELVIKAKTDPTSQYKIGKEFIKKGHNYREIGIKYLKKSIENEVQKSSVLYIQTINYDEIPQVNEFIEMNMSKNKNNLAIHLLNAMILIKQKEYRKAIKIFLELIDKGSSESAHQMEIIYRDGIGVKQNAEKKKKYQMIERTLKKKERIKRIDDTDPDILYETGMKFKETTSNICGAVNYFKSASRKGHIKAMKELVQIYYEGIQSIGINYKKALKYARNAADSGDIESMRKVATMFEDGEGTKQNLIMAAKYYKEAALAGDPYSMNRYALLLEKGDGVEMNKKLACEYFKKAADLDNEFAIFNYAMNLIKGEGVDVNIDEGIKLLKRGVLLGNKKAEEALITIQLKEKIKSGDENAMFEFAQLQENQKKKTKVAIKYYKMAADKGHSGAKKALKILRKNRPDLFNDNEVADSEEDVESMLIRANEMNSRILAFNKALNFDQEPEITEDECEALKLEALKLYKKCAIKGNPDAMVHCGLYYEYGCGIEQNQQKAFDYYSKAADKKFNVGIFRCGLCFEFGKGVEINLSKAVKYYRKAADQNYVKAIVKLAEFLEKGKGCMKNEKEALKLLKKVADKNEKLRSHYEELRDRLKDDDDDDDDDLQEEDEEENRLEEEVENDDDESEITYSSDET